MTPTSSNPAEGFKSLKVIPISQAVTDADKEITERASGVQVGLKTRWDKLNKALLGGFQMGNVYLIAAPSGAGKSYFLNMLRHDFVSLNSSYPRKILVLSFSFEMSAADEVIRTLSSETGLSYGELLSAEKPLNYTDKLRNPLLALANAPIFFVETSGNRKQILATIHAVHTKFPEHELVITFDHSLLTESLDERDELEVLANLAKTCIKIRKTYSSLIILLGQTNDKMEHPLRIQNSSMHYPTKTDIHGSKQLYWACDFVGIMNRPELMGIEAYGKSNYPTKDLIAFHLVKARKGIPGLIRFRQDLAHGRIEQWDKV